MLELKDIKKDYEVADEEVHALKGISLKFRKNEFVSILGPSGCGKTTLLNIIGGLDKYTSGDLIIEGISTKEYKDRDWDTYRNHSIGFIFQSYHLIPHQTILQNVELALMISGVSKRERRKRALEALEKVGLKDKIHNRPNQLSGGQAQRVAIARALINDPEIVLADEPTGALDSKTSVQIMELLKEIAKDRLVIMVTHNPELAQKYSTRIIRLLDGNVMGDTMPYDGSEDAPPLTKQERKLKNKKKGSKSKTAMSPFMAMSLSLKNLLSKRKRTTMVSVAGSIGIIGVSMVLAISAGVQGYINDMEDDMLSGYPVSITSSTVDFTSLMNISEEGVSTTKKQLLNDLKNSKKINVNSLLATLGSFSSDFEKTNTITRDYINYVEAMPTEYNNVVQYGYDFNIVNNLYTDFSVTDLANLTSDSKAAKYTAVTEADNTRNMSVAAIRSMYASVLSQVDGYEKWGSMISTVSTFAEVPDNYDYIMSQYDVVAIDRDGQPVTDGYTDEEVKALFEAKDSLIMVLSGGKIDDLTLAQYGYLNEDQFLEYAKFGIEKDEEAQKNYHLVGDDGLDFSYFIGGKTFTYYPNDTIYSQVQVAANPSYTSEGLLGFMQTNYPYLVNESVTAESFDSLIETINTYSSIPNESGYIRYMLETSGELPSVLIDAIVNYMKAEESAVEGKTEVGYSASAYSDNFSADNSVTLNVKLILQKKESVSYGCLDSGFYYTNALTKYILDSSAESQIVNYIKDGGKLSSVDYTYNYFYVSKNAEGEEVYAKSTLGSGSISGNSQLMSTIISSVSGYGGNEITAGLFGGDDLPSSIYFYPVDFETKDLVTAYLDAWNDTHEMTEQITYTDTVGLIINMVNTMIEMITIALVAFTALSLVVSTVMIGIITYVSVVERVKEIGILRAVGARKKDIKRLFNAETFIIGLVAGVIGIAVTYILSLIVNVIVLIIAGIWGIAALPWWEALIMIALSVGLTLISGLIPASAAAKKDPVVALRTE
jgi:putative ABC transport system permease protein